MEMLFRHIEKNNIKMKIKWVRYYEKRIFSNSL